MFKTKAFLSFKAHAPMFARYIKLKTTPNVLKLARLSTPTFNNLSEQILIEYYGMTPPAKYAGLNFEIRSARLCDNLRIGWKNITPTYSADYLLLMALYPKEPIVYLLNKRISLDILLGVKCTFDQHLWFSDTDERLSPYMVKVVGSDLNDAIEKAQLLQKK